RERRIGCIGHGDLDASCRSRCPLPGEAFGAGIRTMPLKWIRGCNPYVVNYFAKLRLGANADPLRMNASARNLKQKIARGEPVELGGQKLDEHAIEEASTRLRNAAARAEELLLVHAPGQSEQQAPNHPVSNLN